MPPLIRFILRHGLIGFCIGVTFTTLILVLDVGAIRTLTRASTEGTVLRLMLVFLISSTFISVQIAIAVMFPPSRKHDPMAPPDKGDQDDNQ
ncbi:MAG: hypothetical protein GC187_03035 [Alphaproteobacteria bacterium]|nr:hypothetical protein [Alphaproteobacteria bacterium]